MTDLALESIKQQKYSSAVSLLLWLIVKKDISKALVFLHLLMNAPLRCSIDLWVNPDESIQVLATPLK